MKKIIILFLSLLITSCSGLPENMPDITITADETLIPYTSGFDNWNGHITDRIGGISYLIENTGIDNIPTISQNPEFEIKFSSYPPSEIKLYYYFIDENGFNKNDYQTYPLEVNLRGDSIKCKLKLNYENELYAFKLYCKWNLHKAYPDQGDYEFILKT